MNKTGEWRQLSPQGIRRPSPRYRHRPRNRRNYPRLIPVAGATLQKGSRLGTFLQTTVPCRKWPAFTPPHWPKIRPALTAANPYSMPDMLSQTPRPVELPDAAIVQAQCEQPGRVALQQQAFNSIRLSQRHSCYPPLTAMAGNFRCALSEATSPTRRMRRQDWHGRPRHLQ